MCVMCSTSVPTLFQYFFYDHIPTFLYIFHEMSCYYIRLHVYLHDTSTLLLAMIYSRAFRICMLCTYVIHGLWYYYNTGKLVFTIIYYVNFQHKQLTQTEKCL